MKFGLDVWKSTPLSVKVAYLELQKRLQEMEGENHQLREQRDRLRGVSRQCVRYGLTRAEANLAFVSQEERRLVARCAKLRSRSRFLRVLLKGQWKALDKWERDFNDCNQDRQEAIAVLEQVSRERASLQKERDEALVENQMLKPALDGALRHLKALVIGVERMVDEDALDGIPGPIWDAYEQARKALGCPIVMLPGGYDNGHFHFLGFDPETEICHICEDYEEGQRHRLLDADGGPACESCAGLGRECDHCRKLREENTP